MRNFSFRRQPTTLMSRRFSASGWSIFAKIRPTVKALSPVHVSPEVLGGSFGNTGWADAGIVCPYTIWKMYGDTRVISDHYAAMAKYIDYLHKTSKELVRTQGAYGDWLNLGGGAKSEVIGTAYFRACDATAFRNGGGDWEE